MAFTTQWYADMLGREELVSAAINSLILAVVSTAVSQSSVRCWRWAFRAIHGRNALAVFYIS